MLTADEIASWNESGPDAPPPERPILKVDRLIKHFPVHGGLFGRTSAFVQAVDDISFEVLPGETLGIIGEPGCGKSTTARLLMHMITPDQGTLLFYGQPVGSTSLPLKSYRRHVQMVWRDGSASWNPRLTILDSIAAGPVAYGIPLAAAVARARGLLNRVSLDPADFAGRYPHELSGDQLQRASIARALALDARVLILDDAVAALDASFQAGMLALLQDLKDEFDLTYLFISQDLDAVRLMSTRVMVMCLGRIAEIGPTDAILLGGRHPYTRELLSSLRTMEPIKRLVDGPPKPINPPAGCRFHNRCPLAEPVCHQHEPTLQLGDDGVATACLSVQPGSGHSSAGRSSYA